MKKIDIFENGICLQFAVDDDGHLLFYNFSTKKKDSDDFEDMKLPLSAVEVQLAGKVDTRNKHIGHGCPDTPKYKSHEDTRNQKGRLVIFTLCTELLEIKQYYQFLSGTKTVSAYSEVKNLSDERVGLTYLSSFGYGGFEFESLEQAVQDFDIYIPHNSWCEELNWRGQSLREAGLGTKKLHASTKHIRVLNRGCWSTKEYLPMGLLHDKKGGFHYLWQIEANGSWEWELGDLKERLYLRLSGPTDAEHAWYKKLEKNETFKSVPVAITVTSDGLDGAVGEMTKYRRKIINPDRLDKNMPVIFNDFMDCLWAMPSLEKELPLIEKAAALGAEIYCMDAGWYAEGGWWPLVGEWEICEKRFGDEGAIDKVFAKIKEKGMRSGIWLEPEVMGINCPLVPEFEDCFFKYRGEKVICEGRYQLDFRKEKVINHLNRVVDNLVKRLGVSYFKFDYNIDPTFGTETDSDSGADGLMRAQAEYLKWVDSLYEKYPDLIIENCASGGMRMDWESLKHFSIQSISDATHSNEFAHMSVTAPTAVLPEQAGIWVAPSNNNSLNENSLAAVNGMLNRMYLSGRIDLLRDEDFASLKAGVELYKELRSEFADALPIFPEGLNTFENDWMVGGRITTENNIYLTVAHMKGEETERQIEMPYLEKGEISAEILYPENLGSVSAKDGTLTVKLPEKSAILIKITT